jgi:hypothetical protein
LFGILKGMGKEVYTAVYDQLGAMACRILVPGYSEVYPVEDLIWDNTNKALLFREDILNLHCLDDASLSALLDRLENNELDEYADIATLIGIEFDENTEWGQLTVLELKLLIHWPLQQLEEAQELVGAFLQYNDNTVERKLFYQAMNVVLEVQLNPRVRDWKITSTISAVCLAMNAWTPSSARSMAACALFWFHAHQHEVGRAGQAPPLDGQLQKAAHSQGKESVMTRVT